MRRSLLALAFVLPCLPLSAMELAKIDRTIAALPNFSTDKPEYALLVFGPQADSPVWLIRDGGVLYVDRNANGDLTEPGEQIVADTESEPQNGTYSFRVAEITAGGATHRDLRIGISPIDHLRDIIVEARILLDAEPKFRGTSIMLDVERPGQHGDGLGGRVTHCVLGRDPDGFVHWGTSPTDAPVFHFGGAWQIMFQRQQVWRAGRVQNIETSIGTPGVGKGSTVYVGYEKLVPPLLRPKLTVTFPADDGSEPLVASYVLKERCCTINLLDEIKIPDEAASGTAKVELALANWPGAAVAPTVNDVKILPFKPGPAPIPLGARLKTRLRHEHPDAFISHIVFTPDGQRVIAGDYPGGLVNVWDVASGSQLVSMPIIQGNSTPDEYFAITADGNRLIASRSRSGVNERIEQDGKTITKQTFSDSIREWDLQTGRLLQTLSPENGRGTFHLRVSPDGRFVVTFDWVNGLYERPNLPESFAVSLWDLQARTHRQVVSGFTQLGTMSADGRMIAVSLCEPAKNQFFSKSLTVFRLPEWTEVSVIPAEGTALLQGEAFSADGRLLVGTVTTYRTPDQPDAETTLKAWDVSTGKEVFAKPPTSRGQYLGRVELSPDGHSVCYVTSDQSARTGGAGMVDIKTDKSWHIDLAPRTPISETVFHPSGKWFALVTTVFPKDYRHPSLPMDDLEQARLLVIETATGKVLEEQVMPRVQPFVFSIAMSPDGKTLATAGPGEVLLWDFSDSPLP